MPYDLGSFSLLDMLRCGREVRAIASAAKSFEEASASIVEYLYEECSTGLVKNQCALVRFYKTVPYEELDPERQAFAERLLGRTEPWPAMKCLTLLATIGQEPGWCDVSQSKGHQAIPLASVQMVEQAPMIARLIKEMGLEIHELLASNPPSLAQRAGKSYNVFHVADAAGSPYIPAQDDFVEPYGVKSVLGFGGLLGDGEFFAVIMFSRRQIPQASAERFRNIALDLKAAIHRLSRPKLTS